MVGAGPILASAPGGVRLRLRVRPGAARNAILGRTVLADGEAALLVAVAAPPSEGRANAALVELLAKVWRLPKSGLTVVAGASGRTKLLHIEGDPAALMARLGDWLAALPEA